MAMVIVVIVVVMVMALDNPTQSELTSNHWGQCQSHFQEDVSASTTGSGGQEVDVSITVAKCKSAKGAVGQCMDRIRIDPSDLVDTLTGTPNLSSNLSRNCFTSSPKGESVSSTARSKR